MEVGDLPGRKCQPDQAVIDLFRHYGGGQAGGKRCPQGAVEQALRLIADGGQFLKSVFGGLHVRVN